MTVGLALNIVIIVLLLTTIFFCLRLGKKVSKFNTTKAELAGILEEFSSSISKAEQTINNLKSVGNAVDSNLQSQIKKARFLANDLSFLAEKAENVADVLDNKITMSRDIYRKVSADSIIMQSGNNSANKKLQMRDNVTGHKVQREGKVGSSDHQSLSKPNPNNINNKKSALDSLLKQIAKKKAEINN